MTTVAVIGVGAIGGTVAAHLAQTGRAELSLGVRRPVDGLAVAWQGQTLPLHGRMVTEPASVSGPVDWVLLATKAHQTAGAADWLQRLCGPATTVAVLQNGVEHVERVTPLIGPARCLPAVVNLPAERVQPDLIEQRAEARLTVPDGAAGRALQALFAGSGVQIICTDDIVTALWTKLSMNVPSGAICAVLGQRTGVFRQPAIAELGRTLGAECVAVGRAAGAKLDPALADQIVDRLRSASPNAGNSMLYDRLAGRPLEWEARNGVVVRLGERYGIPTPANRAIVALLAAIDTAARGD